MRTERTELRLTTLAHQLVASRSRGGGIAVDATVGNGHDTLFLREQVGEEGQVIGVDVQSEALNAARARIKAQFKEWPSNVRLIQRCHSKMDAILADCAIDEVDVVMFNLGYLPGSDHSVTTLPHTTLAAVSHSLSTLRRGGQLLVMVYVGHDGGKRELERLLEAIDGEALSAAGVSWTRYESAHAATRAPVLLVAERG